jgi:hypothetical protein
MSKARSWVLLFEECIRGADVCKIEWITAPSDGRTVVVITRRGGAVTQGANLLTVLDNIPERQ